MAVVYIMAMLPSNILWSTELCAMPLMHWQLDNERRWGRGGNTHVLTYSSTWLRLSALELCCSNNIETKNSIWTKKKKHLWHLPWIWSVNWISLGFFNKHFQHGCKWWIIVRVERDRFVNFHEATVRSEIYSWAFGEEGEVGEKFPNMLRSLLIDHSVFFLPRAPFSVDLDRSIFSFYRTFPPPPPPHYYVHVLHLSFFLHSRCFGFLSFHKERKQQQQLNGKKGDLGETTFVSKELINRVCCTSTFLLIPVN